jgi:hypothetical protein
VDVAGSTTAVPTESMAFEQFADAAAAFLGRP